MTTVLDGTAASEGIGAGVVAVLGWGVPAVPHATVPDEEIPDEIARFHEALAAARDRLLEIQATTDSRLGSVEARIFEPQLLMLDDHEVVEGTIRYIRDLGLTAARAFEWRMLELQAMWSRTAQPMVLDRLNDLEDLMIRVLHGLLGRDDPSDLPVGSDPLILVARNLTPTLTVHLDPEHVVGVATDEGTRTAHWAMLARSLGIPAVVGLGTISRQARDGMEALLDGRAGRVVLEPDAGAREDFDRRRVRRRTWEGEIREIAAAPSVTADGHEVVLRANLDLPIEAEPARAHGAVGVGLFRTEFLVVGRSSMPGEEEQFEAYRAVAEAFPGEAVCIRTFDLGGDKFPIFLHMPREENPFLGWRAIRVCLDEPALFRTQLRAILRATVHGDIRMMLPLVNDVEEIERVRVLLGEVEEELRGEGVPFDPDYRLGVMIETPAAAIDAPALAELADFVSIGTNDLVQYTLAVDRTNARLAPLYTPFHPAVLRLLETISDAAREADLELSVCGEMASNPLGAWLLLGLDITTLSLAWPSLPEIKALVRAVRLEDAREAARRALREPTVQGVRGVLTEALRDAADLDGFSGSWSLSSPG